MTVSTCDVASCSAAIDQPYNLCDRHRAAAELYRACHYRAVYTQARREIASRVPPTQHPAPRAKKR